MLRLLPLAWVKLYDFLDCTLPRACIVVGDVSGKGD